MNTKGKSVTRRKQKKEVISARSYKLLELACSSAPDDKERFKKAMEDIMRGIDMMREGALKLKVLGTLIAEYFPSEKQ